MAPRIGNTLDVPTQSKIYARTPKTANIVDVFFQATDVDLEDGLTWYTTANEIASRIANGNVVAGAGVLAALSPLKDWEENVKLAELAFSQGFASKHMKGNCAKATAIIQGADPLAVLGGNKVRNFYAAIAEPTCEAVVIDRHAFDVAVGRVTNDATRAVLSRVGVYEAFARKYVLASKEISKRVGYPVSASQVQAVCWVTFRRLKGLD